MYILYETAIGYFLFFCTEDFSCQIKTSKFNNFIQNYFDFFNKLKFRAFVPFKSNGQALQNFICLSDGIANKFLLDFLRAQFPKKLQNFILGIEEPKLANYIYKQNWVQTISNEVVVELIRGIRIHSEKLIQHFVYTNLKQSQVSLAHIFSHSKMNLGLQKTDNMIIQSISLLEQIEKDINSFSMNIKEWYSWHFPELINIISDPYVYTLVIKFIGNRKSFNIKKTRELEILIMNEEKAQEIFEASKTSVGSNILSLDLLIIEKLSTKIILMSEFRNHLIKYLEQKLNFLAPNLVALIGENLAAKLIVKAGSLKNLAKYPSSTIQILGAEKALFRALKKKTKTPKYGVLFNSSFISKTNLINKGKASRFLANKCSLAVRIDYFSFSWTNVYGKKLKEQVINIINCWETPQNLLQIDMGEI